MEKFDYIIIGAGIVGLSIGRRLVEQKLGSVCIVEKEPTLGVHASGRNSGVLHAGIYYSSDSLKAKFCKEGAKALGEYAIKKNIPYLKTGKVIVAHNQETTHTLETLFERALKNGVNVKKITRSELKEIEPMADTFDWALLSPDTAIIDSKKVLAHLKQDFTNLGGSIKYNSMALEVDSDKKQIQINGRILGYECLINAAGNYADRIAHQMGVASHLKLLPFKGVYWKLADNFSKSVNGAIYPAPDIKMPFLGVHITRGIDGKVLLGPTAIPALGRENYHAFSGLNFNESSKMFYYLAKNVD